MPNLVTIGIPVFQAKDYIEATMQSALSQTYPNIEFLVVDDCGNDGTVDVIEQLQKSHPRGQSIRIVRNEHNMGVGPSRNRIIDEAEGRYLYFMDSDDVIEPNTIELLLEAILQHHADIVYASYEKIDNVDNGPTKQFVYPSLSLHQPEALAMYAFKNYGSFQVSVCNWLVDLTFLRETGLMFIDAMYWEDMAFTYELVTKVRRAVLLPNIAYHYLCRPHSLSNYHDREVICKEEIQKNISTIDYLKWKCRQLRDKTYAPYMCYDLEMNSFYIICHILKHQQRISPSFTNAELHQCMQLPLSFSDLVRFKHKRAYNIALWLIAHLPIPVFMPIIKVLGRKKGVL
jgi:glycosyltransferase involved in cell wall biosynthesis